MATRLCRDKRDSIVVFQSSQQKYDFLNLLFEKYNISVENDWSIQIINGVQLAENMGLKLKKEVAAPYQCANIELKDLILD